MSPRIPINLLWSLRIRAYALRTRRIRRNLVQANQNQMTSFMKLSERFSGAYDSLRECDVSDFTTPMWDGFRSGLEDTFLPIPPFSFLRNPIILKTMFVTAGGRWMKEELTYLEGHMTETRLRELLAEDYVGDPYLFNAKYMTSHNTIHTLYHLARYSATTGCNLEDIHDVVEWGGGYGNLARIFQRLKSPSLTYTIVDLPIMSMIQWIYLSSILGEDKVRLIQTPEVSLKSGAINLLPVCHLEHYEPRGDLFVSTWALNESSEKAQEYVISRAWFNSKHVLLGYAKDNPISSNSGLIRRAASDGGAAIEPIDFLPDSSYAFL
jgi:hypothetical protein